ncbi:MAG: PilT/PilU family type 4a pilus ATPase [Archangiaceae bacterium]|nr:PilT/PilU family type 4a pilus ATPase [Archangiaceae bacterium]
MSQPSLLLQKLLAGAASAGASDIHLRANQQPFVRIDGHLRCVNGVTLTEADIDAILLATSGNRTVPAGATEWEYSYDAPDLRRFRGHAFRENDRWAIALRLIPASVPGFQELRLPVAVKSLVEKAAGLTLITGPTGSGKTTTAFSMLQHTCTAQSVHLISIEDPVEFRIQAPGSCIAQREVGRDTPSYEAGLKGALREDPDLLFIGEIRDRPSLEAALHASETGHGVIATIHTQSTAHTIQRLVAMMPTEEQPATRERLADCMRGIVSQRLLPRKKGRGRVLATEVCMNSHSVKDLIRDPARLRGMVQLLERGGDRFMHSLDQDLTALVREGVVEAEIAIGNATSPTDLRRNLTLAGLVAA